jgi:hypothetical protein
MRPDHGDSALRIGRNLAQCLERRREHARNEPAPASMHGSHGARRRRDQHRQAIRGDDTDRQLRHVAHQRIRVVCERARRRRRAHDRAPVHLTGAHQIPGRPASPRPEAVDDAGRVEQRVA